MRARQVDRYCRYTCTSGQQHEACMLERQVDSKDVPTYVQCTVWWLVFGLPAHLLHGGVPVGCISQSEATRTCTADSNGGTSPPASWWRAGWLHPGWRSGWSPTSGRLPPRGAAPERGMRCRDAGRLNTCPQTKCACQVESTGRSPWQHFVGDGGLDHNHGGLDHTVRLHAPKQTALRVCTYT